MTADQMDDQALAYPKCKTILTLMTRRYVSKFDVAHSA